MRRFFSAGETNEKVQSVYLCMEEKKGR